MNARVQELFEELCDLPVEERERRLNALTPADLPLRELVESLLRSHDGGGRFLSEATAVYQSGNSLAGAVGEKPGDSIGNYRLLEQIGEGGFGQVFMAQQLAPVRRRVAMKIIKVGMDTGQTLLRFEAERQALAVMDHPNIARVFDGGATTSGRPYFVMELVRGEAITTYCDRCRLSIPERLTLFQQVCYAIEHAHQKGIVHRDIKPNNVLVTVADGRPLVKVIDFGIAKALNAELTEKTLYTEFRQLIGTPQYMSPEQAERSGVDIDTRSDIFSLGVLLYEMLTGDTPVESQRLRSAAWGQWQRMIVDEEPSRPSLKVSTTLKASDEIARQRSVDPVRLRNMLSGDIDWIVLKSLEKDRSRRYATAHQFAEDIDRMLTNRPVLATPPGRIYLCNKFVKRHRSAVMFTSLLLASLILGLVTTGIFANRARIQRDMAMKALREAELRTIQVRRLASLAGSPLLNKDEADRLATEWGQDVAQMQTTVGENDVAAVRMECQYTTWLIGHCLRYRDDRIMSIAQEKVRTLLPNARTLLTVKDANFLSLLNASIQLSGSTNAPAADIALLYDDMIVALAEVRGAAAARELLPEYATTLVRAHRDDDAEKVLARFLSETKPGEISGREWTLLNKAVNDLAAWGVTHAAVYEPLRSLRDSGRATELTDGKPSEADDAELADDLKTMQGTWTLSADTIQLELVIRDHQADVTFFDNAGTVVRRDNAQFVLTRSGAAKLITRFRMNQTEAQGDAMIYSLAADTMVNVEGMLTGMQNQTTPRLRTWTRKR